MTGELNGRRVLLTGATGGIGSVIARTLAAHGASLALVARSERQLSALVGSLGSGGHDAFHFDVSDEDAWIRARSRIAPEGLLHGAVTAAALLEPVGPVGTWSTADFRRTLDVNVVGTLLAVSTMLGPLTSSRGSIVTFSGGGATGPFPRFDAYAASKAAVVRLTENLASELKQAGVRANSVAPGFVVSRMHETTLTAGSTLVGDDYFERTRRTIEEGRGDPPELAGELVAYLLSDRSTGISGKLLSARWDPWRDPAFQRRLVAEPDLATLRRIDDQFFVSRADARA